MALVMNSLHYGGEVGHRNTGGTQGRGALSQGKGRRGTIGCVAGSS